MIPSLTLIVPVLLITPPVADVNKVVPALALLVMVPLLVMTAPVTTAVICLSQVTIMVPEAPLISEPPPKLIFPSIQLKVPLLVSAYPM